jgi:ubiquinone/menaquinone biosynthesis C-methylase UbiE
MKTTIIAPGPIYAFLRYCEESPLDKKVLDCGAGGDEPPLALFHDFGYKTHGVDISRKQLERARRFCERHGLDLGIVRGDMRRLAFGDESMSFVYSYSAICHMSKADVGVAMGEITRVLRPGGLCYVSFLMERTMDGEVKESGKGAAARDEDDDEPFMHCFFETDEPAIYFCDYELLRRTVRREERFGPDHRSSWAEVDYIARKR